MRKKEKENDALKRELDEAVDIVNAFINGTYKSMYLIDSWVKIKDYIAEKNI